MRRIFSLFHHGYFLLALYQTLLINQYIAHFIAHTSNRMSDVLLSAPQCPQLPVPELPLLLQDTAHHSPGNQTAVPLGIIRQNRLQLFP